MKHNQRVIKKALKNKDFEYRKAYHNGYIDALIWAGKQVDKKLKK